MGMHKEREKTRRKGGVPGFLFRVFWTAEWRGSLTNRDWDSTEYLSG